MNNLPQKPEAFQVDVKQLCFSVINIVAPETKMDDNIKGWLYDLDFVEIVMRTEIEFDCTIKEG